MMDGILVTPVTLVGFASQTGVDYMNVLKFLWMEITTSVIVRTINFTN